MGERENMGFTIFVSHAHDDARLVEALSAIIDDTLDDVEVRSSSDRPGRGGIEPGTSWLSWIHRSVTESDATIVVLTSVSSTRPWLLWEAGAVSGVALSSEQDKPIIPLVFELSPDEIPDPLRDRQLAAGDSEVGISGALEAIYGRIQRPSAEKFHRLLRLRVPEYLNEVRSILDERRAALAVAREDMAPPLAAREFYDKTFQAEDLDLTIVNFEAFTDPEDLSGVAIRNKAGDWILEIDVESPLRGMKHAADIRFRRGRPDAGGKVLLRVDSGQLGKHEEIVDMATVRHNKYVVDYLIYEQVSRVAKIQIRPLDDDARQAEVFCMDSVSVYSLPRGGGLTA
jgi:TIR domain